MSEHRIEAQDAVVFLDDIEHNRLSAALLPWAVLMRRGQSARTAKRWAKLAARLGETQRRNAAALAWTFCQLTTKPAQWKTVLEALPMDESIAVREWRKEGRLEVQRECLNEVLRAKLSGESLAAIIERVEKQDDLAVLSRWLDRALTLSPELILGERKG